MFNTAHHGGGTGQADIRAHAHQFLNMHEAVFKNGFVDHAGTVGQTEQSHELSLHVGGKTGVGTGTDIHAAQSAASRPGKHAVRPLDDIHARFAQLDQHGVHVIIRAVPQQKLPARDACRGQKGSCLDAIRHDRVFTAVERAHAPHPDNG